jgi:hypothetical protein
MCHVITFAFYAPTASNQDVRPHSSANAESASPHNAETESHNSGHDSSHDSGHASSHNSSHDSNQGEIGFVFLIYGWLLYSFPSLIQQGS